MFVIKENFSHIYILQSSASLNCYATISYVQSSCGQFSSAPHTMAVFINWFMVKLAT